MVAARDARGGMVRVHRKSVRIVFALLGKTPPVAPDPIEESVEAHVSHGRWCVQCPDIIPESVRWLLTHCVDSEKCSGDHPSAEYTSFTEPARRCTHASMYCATVPVYICPVHEVWLTVTLPKNRAELEAVLVLRPVDPAAGATKANWRPGETLGDLRMENEAHGITG